MIQKFERENYKMWSTKIIGPSHRSPQKRWGMPLYLQPKIGPIVHQVRNLWLMKMQQNVFKFNELKIQSSQLGSNLTWIFQLIAQKSSLIQLENQQNPSKKTETIFFAKKQCIQDSVDRTCYRFADALADHIGLSVAKLQLARARPCPLCPVK